MSTAVVNLTGRMGSSSNGLGHGSLTAKMGVRFSSILPFLKGGNMTFVYLCGPINGCTDEECNDWRSYVKKNLDSCYIIDPMRRDYRGREEESYREIVELDKVDVARTDALIVSAPKPSVGTSMEVLLAWQLGKFIVVVVPNGTVISPWLRYHAHHIVTSYKEALDLIEIWDRSF